MKYTPTIGLEIHVELKTRTKMFCDSLNDPDEKRPNVNICPVCMGHPGTLPVANKEAVRKVLLVGKSLGGKLADYSRFDRKNYFYPDIPKGYQISQYKHPLVEGGELGGVEITRIHLEEDTGKLAHAEDGSSSLVDFNRAGVPLMELVTEPCVKSGKEARRFGEELQLILRYLGASDAEMEKGQMRVEVNISLAEEPGTERTGKSASLGTVITGKPTEAELSSSFSKKLGTKVEIKNLNSFRAVERAIEYEIERQSALLEAGEKVKQETRGWDEGKQKTFSQREKEAAHDYRYFPEPDLPPLIISELGFDLSLPELPEEKRKRFKEKYGLKEEAVEVFVRDMAMGKFFESVVDYLVGKKSASLGTGITGKPTEAEPLAAPVLLGANYIISDLNGLAKEKGVLFSDIKVNPEIFAKLITMTDKGAISSRGAKDVLKIMFEEGGDPEQIVKEKGLAQTSDDSFIKNIVEEVINKNPAVTEDYRRGKEAALQFLIGQGMKFSKGKANPEVLKKFLKEKLQ
ncbi:MAG: Asp-tRNA(Asn)/Glu-tRNA(Gln) amidotransferase subunit GatB [Candidatus Pacebacteria bacterium]|nr:Asp-tRNA(Asn)/Glu-tRNA(Gln) amidotransferase subunit GatB [Candidatus Paceibacterota bacterium]